MCVYIHVCYTRTYIYPAFLFLRTRGCEVECLSAWMCACGVYMHIHVYIYVYTHTYTHTHTYQASLLLQTKAGTITLLSPGYTPFSLCPFFFWILNIPSHPILWVMWHQTHYSALGILLSLSLPLYIQPYTTYAAIQSVRTRPALFIFRVYVCVPCVCVCERVVYTYVCVCVCVWMWVCVCMNVRARMCHVCVWHGAFSLVRGSACHRCRFKRMVCVR